VKVFVADIRKAERELGWKPKVGVEERVGRSFEWVPWVFQRFLSIRLGILLSRDEINIPVKRKLAFLA